MKYGEIEGTQNFRAGRHLAGATEKRKREVIHVLKYSITWYGKLLLTVAGHLKFLQPYAS